MILIENTEGLAKDGLEDMVKAAILGAIEGMNPDQNVHTLVNVDGGGEL